MEKQMKAVGIKMAVCMGVTMSFFLSLVGTLHGMMSSGRPFAPVAWLISFVVGLIISLIIGLLVPMVRINRAIQNKMGPGIKTRIVDSLISNLIYTPVITLIMVALNYRQAEAQAAANGGHIPFLAMFLPSLILCFIVGWIIIFIAQPLFVKLLLPKGAGGPGMRPQQGPEDTH